MVTQEKEKGTIKVPLSKCELEYNEESGKMGITCAPEAFTKKAEDNEPEETKADGCMRFEFSKVKVKRSK